MAAKTWEATRKELLDELNQVSNPEKAILAGAVQIAGDIKRRVFEKGESVTGKTYKPSPKTVESKKGRFGTISKLIFTETRELQNSIVAIPLKGGAGIAAQGSREDKLTNKELADILDEDFDLFDLNKDEDKIMDQAIDEFINNIF